MWSSSSARERRMWTSFKIPWLELWKSILKQVMEKSDHFEQAEIRSWKDLVKAQTLFNLPIQTYPELLQLEKDFLGAISTHQEVLTPGCRLFQSPRLLGLAVATADIQSLHWAQLHGQWVQQCISTQMNMQTLLPPLNTLGIWFWPTKLPHVFLKPFVSNPNFFALSISSKTSVYSVAKRRRHCGPSLTSMPLQRVPKTLTSKSEECQRRVLKMLW